jgi:hypothetical protein
MNLRGWIKKKRTALGWWLLDLPKDKKQICLLALDSGWFSRQLHRLHEFCRAEVDKVSPKGGGLVSAAGLFRLYFGRDVKFELEVGGPGREVYESRSLVLQKLKSERSSKPK